MYTTQKRKKRDNFFSHLFWNHFFFHLTYIEYNIYWLVMRIWRIPCSEKLPLLARRKMQGVCEGPLGFAT